VVGGEADRWVPPVGERERGEKRRWAGKVCWAGGGKTNGPRGKNKKEEKVGRGWKRGREEEGLFFSFSFSTKLF
jgi:hypothetical protein